MRFFRLRDGGDFYAVLGPVAPERSPVTGRSQIRVVEQFAFRLLLLDSGGGLRKREHIEVGGDAEDERLF